MQISVRMTIHFFLNGFSSCTFLYEWLFISLCIGLRQCIFLYEWQSILFLYVFSSCTFLLYLLRHKKITPEGRDNTSSGTLLEVESHPVREIRRIPENLRIRLRGKNHQVTQTTSEIPSKTSDIKNKTTGDKIRYPRGNRAVKCEKLARKKDFEGTPRAHPSRPSIWDTADKPVQVNIQGVGICLVKLKNTN